MCAIELNIPYSRVYSSYNIFKSLPPEMAKKIIWKTSGMSKKEAGFIGGSVATNILTRFAREHVSEMFEVTQKFKLTSGQIDIVYELMRSKKCKTIMDAIKVMDDYEIHRVRLVLNKKVADRICEEMHTGKSRSITWIILKCLRRGIRLPSDMFVAPGED